ncbi:MULTISPECIES: sensor histidine kinase [unclassified Cryobacterium]|uniref:sensor histidine kinase n=1 Tax=unclassified Cryobacterium TaxID=2649013 RepID=UPI00106949D0|nr:MULTISPECIES: sensor histidine kinase [unclassified Cryobacterium]MDY7529324.1 sensor histidine kinase [Cryobacterium sp. 10C2]MDY7558522.1 sensor histidine kinase [Cryobacterium sp. 10C3]MEB0002685.1 sensor histidine kinase [Cryobacterium sp. RTC2.1]MEB0203026.1 sensor histidine kinase [Cryobacterium sp. 5I3]MEB0287398.1 sensor histidine kinase [Cryobacterium sp. 10S3]
MRIPAMTTLRWWDVAVGGSLLLMGVLAAADQYRYGHELSRIGALATLVAIGIGYVGFGRRAIACPTGRTGSVALAATVFRGVLIVGVGVAAAFNPSLATLQAIAFPLLWTLTDSFLVSVALSALLAASAGAGLWLGIGGTPAALGQAYATEGISFVFAIAMGAWITRIARDGSTQRRLYEELSLAQDELAALHRDAGSAAERERLAREIHDTIAQSLTSLVMLAQRAGSELGPDSGARPTVELIEDTARQALTEARSLVAAMSPVRVGDSTLAETLRRLAGRFERETGIQVRVILADTGLDGLDRENEVVLLRCAQEGLANVRKHSRAGAASVRLEHVGTDAVLTVTDDGRGLGAYAPAQENGFGLSGMRDRLALVGGRLTVGAGERGGTVLRVTVPAAEAGHPTISVESARHER